MAHQNSLVIYIVMVVLVSLLADHSRLIVRNPPISETYRAPAAYLKYQDCWCFIDLSYFFY